MGVAMRLFALNASRAFGERVAAAFGRPLDEHEERDFEDGEHKARPLVSVRGEDVYVLQSLHGDAQASGDDKLVRLLFFCAALRDHGAARVTALVPYLAYGRKERQTKPFDPVSTRYLAQLVEAVGVDALVTLEAHSVAALQNAFRIPTVHIDAAVLFAGRAGEFAGDGPLAVVSPDPGGVKRAQLFGELLQRRLGRPVGNAFIEKRRSAGTVSGSLLAGEVDGATVLLIDDLIATGGTLRRAAATCLQAGAQRVIALAAHGLFAPGAEDMLLDPALAAVVVGDAVPAPQLSPAARARITYEPAAPLFARAVECLAGDLATTELTALG
jgi:ribose-phosphate pyrophosphokinase